MVHTFYRIRIRIIRIMLNYRMCEVLIERIMSPWLRPNFIWKLSPQGRKEKKMKKILHRFIEKVICQRKELKNRSAVEGCDTGRHSFLDILLDSSGLSDADIRDETQTFIFGVRRHSKIYFLSKSFQYLKK